MNHFLWCFVLLLSGSVAAQNCTTFAGSFDLTPVERCLTESVLASYQSDAQLDADDQLEFILHTNPGSNLGQIIYRSDQPILEFQGNMQVEQWYYLSAVAGNMSSDTVDLNDPCLDVSPGVPILFLALPSVDVGLDTAICLGESLAIPLDLEGDGPYEFKWLKDGITIETYTVSGDTSIIVAPTQSTTYSTSQLVGSRCNGVTLGAAVVEVDSVVQLENIQQDCEEFTYSIQFEVSGNKLDQLQITGWPGSLVDALFTSAPIPHDTAYSFSVSNGGACPPTLISGLDSCDCGLLDPGTMKTDEILEVCENQLAVGIPLQPAAFDTIYELLYVLHDNAGDHLGAIFDFGPTPAFSFQDILQYDSIYYISAVVGPVSNGQPDLNEYCRATAAGTPIRFVRVPEAPFSIDGPFALCPGETIEVTLDAPQTDTLSYAFGVPPNDTLFSESLNLSIENISGQNTGDYFGYTNDGRCLSDPVGPLPIQVADCTAQTIQEEVVLCKTANYYLQAVPLSSSCQGIWSSPGPVQIEQENATQTQVSDLQIGANLFVWTVNPGSDCESKDTTIVYRTAPPQLEDDEISIPNGRNQIRFDPFRNDQLNGTFVQISNLFIDEPPPVGNVQFDESRREFVYRIDDLAEPLDTLSFTYTLCNEACLGACDIARIRVRLPQLVIGIPEGITPNNDGVNDALLIRNIDQYPAHQVIIVNRWGDEVLNTRNYDNNRPWDGRYQGQELPQGVYYLQLIIRGEEPISRSIHLIKSAP